MELKLFFTEYDESIASDLNVDPLGLQVIWSVYGQQIFKKKVSSISNDVRNYTINLFHHYIIKKFIENESIKLSKRVLKEFEGKKDSLSFKQACIVYLENIFVYSVVELGDQPGLDTSGILGISKARRRWNENNLNPFLTFSKDPNKSNILVRQLLLGVSGRYKTPMIEMGLFDKSYTYNIPKSADDWLVVEKFINKTPELMALKIEIDKQLEMLLVNDSKSLSCNFDTVPLELKQAYVESFKSPKFVGGYSRDFWLEISGLNKGASGALLKVLDEYFNSSNQSSYSPQMLFIKAKEKIQSDLELVKIESIEKIEPFLADIDLLFSLIISQKSQNKDEVIKAWKTFDRNENTLKLKAEEIYKDKELLSVLSGSGLTRINKLLDLRNTNTLSEQFDSVVKYHNYIMKVRNQSPWIKVDSSNLIKVLVKQRKAPNIEDKPVGVWVNQYYIHQFSNLVSGFQGVKHEAIN
jgi:hypothetical protein